MLRTVHPPHRPADDSSAAGASTGRSTTFLAPAYNARVKRAAASASSAPATHTTSTPLHRKAVAAVCPVLEKPSSPFALRPPELPASSRHSRFDVGASPDRWVSLAPTSSFSLGLTTATAMDGATAIDTMTELARTGAALVARRIASVRERQQQQDDYGAAEALQAVALLFCMALLPTLVRVRILYTFCWVGFTAAAHYTDSQAALGLSTSLGLTIMLGWYSLRALVDRSTFLGILQGWFGFLSKFAPFRLLANTVDVLLHMMVPLVLALCYLPLVRLWMTVPILIFSQMWIYFVAGGDLYPNGNDVYHFYPPRSKAFWTAARKIELFFNVTVPLGCVFVYKLGLHHLIVDGFILP